MIFGESTASAASADAPASSASASRPALAAMCVPLASASSAAAPRSDARRGAVGPGVASTATNRVTLANWSRRQPNSFAARAAASSTRARFSGGAASPFASASADRADDAAAEPNANGYDSSLFAKKPRTTYSVSPGPSQK